LNFDKNFEAIKTVGTSWFLLAKVKVKYLEFWT